MQACPRDPVTLVNNARVEPMDRPLTAQRPAPPRALAWLAALALLAWAPASPALAQSASGHISQGKLLYSAQEYDKAVSSFRKAQSAKGATDATKAEALKYLGLIAVILRKPKAAKRHFLRLLQLRPDFQLDSSNSPKLVNAFNKVKKEFDAQRKVTIQDLSPKTMPSAKPLELRVKLQDKFKQVSRVTLWFRIEGQPDFTKRSMQEVKNPGWQSRLEQRHEGFGVRIAVCADKKPAARAPSSSAGARYFSFTIPKFVGRTEAYDIEYYVVAANASGKSLVTLGTAARPQRTRRTVEAPKPKKPKPTPIYKKWWLWTIVGVGVAGGVVAIVAATLPKAPPTPETGSAVITVIKPKY